jgi:hypothetical protein
MSNLLAMVPHVALYPGFTTACMNKGGAACTLQHNGCEIRRCSVDVAGYSRGSAPAIKQSDGYFFVHNGTQLNLHNTPLATVLHVDGALE